MDPFSLTSEHSPRAGSPTGKHTLMLLLLFGSGSSKLGELWPSSDGDLFDEAMDGGPVNENDRGGSSPEPFDLSRLGESLAAPSPRQCRTPESFLGPEGASLVNLDLLIPVNAPVKTTNPFLSGDYGPKIYHFNFQHKQEVQWHSVIGVSFFLFRLKCPFCN